MPGRAQPNGLNMEDLASFVAPVRRFGTSPGDANFSARWDLVPGSVSGPAVNIEDIAATIAGEGGYPLMFGFRRALGQTCRWKP